MSIIVLRFFFFFHYCAIIYCEKFYILGVFFGAKAKSVYLKDLNRPKLVLFP